MLVRKLVILTFGLILSISAATAATNVVQIGSYFFNPTNTTVNIGDTVLWTNTVAAATPHDVTRTNTPFTWFSMDLNNTRRTFSILFSNAGSYFYFCNQHVYAFMPANRHPEQTGSVSVVSAPLPTNATLTAPTRLPGGQFKFTVLGTSGQTYAIEGSTNLNSWSAIFTNVAPANTFNVTDFTSTNVLLRYYRTRQNL
jgi:plastocyanin